MAKGRNGCSCLLALENVVCVLDGRLLQSQHEIRIPAITHGWTLASSMRIRQTRYLRRALRVELLRELKPARLKIGDRRLETPQLIGEHPKTFVVALIMLGKPLVSRCDVR